MVLIRSKASVNPYHTSPALHNPAEPGLEYRIIEMWRIGASLSLVAIPLPGPPTESYLGLFELVCRTAYENWLVWVVTTVQTILPKEMVYAADFYISGAKDWTRYDLNDM